MSEKLTPKQERFVSEYLTNGRDATAAYRVAYNTKATGQRASEEGCKLLKHPKIAPRIAAVAEQACEAVQVSVEDIVRGLKAEAEYCGEGASHSARVAAWAHLGKYRGMFVDRVKHEGGITIQTLVGPPPAEILGTASHVGGDKDHPA